MHSKCKQLPQNVFCPPLPLKKFHCPTKKLPYGYVPVHQVPRRSQTTYQSYLHSVEVSRQLASDQCDVKLTAEQRPRKAVVEENKTSQETLWCTWIALWVRRAISCCEHALESMHVGINRYRLQNITIDQ